MATITAKNIGRINVWPTYHTAREADTEESKFVGQLTVWRTNEEARANISHEEEGGGGNGGGNWWPADAKIHIDLVGNRAWTEADGEVAVDTLLGSDPNTEEAWGTSNYDPANLTMDGYVKNGSDFPAFIGSALTMVLDGATIVVKTKRISGNLGFSPFTVVAADGNDAIETDLDGYGYVTASSYGGSFSASIASIVNIGAGAFNVVAVTLTASRFDIAVNASDAVAGSLASDDRPSGNPFVAALIDPNADNAIQSITIYDALSDTDGLSELSDTGVINTAPTDIEISWEDQGSLGSNGTYLQNVVTANGGPVVLSGFTMIDAEGNSGALTLVAVDTPDVLEILPEQIRIRAIADFPATGPFNFTIRATDPGGLYVEREFTITVVAEIE